MKHYLKSIPEVSLWKKAAAFIIFILGLYFLIHGELIGLLLFVFCLILIESRGTEIDVINRKYRNVYSVLGFGFGKWKVLPEIDYVSVFKMKTKTRVWVSTASAIVKDEVIVLNLFYDTNKKIKAFEIQDIEEAFNIAREISSALNIKIFDATQRGNTKWLD